MAERVGPGPVPDGCWLQVIDGFYEGLTLPVEREWMVIGRGRGSDLVIGEPTLSRAHAAFGWDGEGFFVQDLGSTNGTLVNGETEKRMRLARGDEVQIGRLRLRVDVP